ncbi:MAG TPA: hypothetical protein VN788_01445 [Verrucomicrobiae bacterium]|nr:hypothetical protein [Verrucomicrobiae bacterium]
MSFLIGLISAFLLWMVLQNDYYDYLYFPKVKAVDAYIYPQLRYTIFDYHLDRGLPAAWTGSSSLSLGFAAFSDPMAFLTRHSAYCLSIALCLLLYFFMA